jgi:hypothetical protein
MARPPEEHLEACFNCDREIPEGEALEVDLDVEGRVLACSEDCKSQLLEEDEEEEESQDPTEAG